MVPSAQNRTRVAPLSVAAKLRTLCSRSHEGPVWQVAWAHPMFGNILASCSYDRKVIVWKEENGSWDKMYEYTGHESSGQLDWRRWRRRPPLAGAGAHLGRGLGQLL